MGPGEFPFKALHNWWTIARVQPLNKLYLSSPDLEATTLVRDQMQIGLRILVALYQPKKYSKRPHKRFSSVTSLKPKNLSRLVGSTCWLTASPHLFSSTVLNWEILPLKGHLVMTGTFLVVTAWGRGATGIRWVESRVAANLPTMHRTAPHHKELLGSKCKEHWV